MFSTLPGTPYPVLRPCFLETSYPVPRNNVHRTPRFLSSPRKYSYQAFFFLLLPAVAKSTPEHRLINCGLFVSLKMNTKNVTKGSSSFKNWSELRRNVFKSVKGKPSMASLIHWFYPHSKQQNSQARMHTIATNNIDHPMAESPGLSWPFELQSSTPND